MAKLPSFVGLGVAIGLSLAGIVGFVLLFVPRMDMYWFILAPMIFAVYQIPAVVIFALWKKKRRKALAPSEDPSGPDSQDEAQPPASE